MRLLLLLIAGLLWTTTAAAQTPADLPGLPHLPGFHIDEYTSADKGSFDFTVARNTGKKIAGKKHHYEYLIDEGAKVPSKSDVFLHYMNLAKKAGGSVPFEDLNDNVCTFTFKHQGRTIWGSVSIYEEVENYTLDVIEQ